MPTYSAKCQYVDCGEIKVAVSEFSSCCSSLSCMSKSAHKSLLERGAIRDKIAWIQVRNQEGALIARAAMDMEHWSLVWSLVG